MERGVVNRGKHYKAFIKDALQEHIRGPMTSREKKTWNRLLPRLYDNEGHAGHACKTDVFYFPIPFSVHRTRLSLYINAFSTRTFEFSGVQDSSILPTVAEPLTA